MGLAIWGWTEFTSSRSIWVLTGGGILAGVMVYTTGLWIMGTSEINQVYQAVLSRFKSPGI